MVEIKRYCIVSKGTFVNGELVPHEDGQDRGLFLDKSRELSVVMRLKNHHNDCTLWLMSEWSAHDTMNDLMADEHVEHNWEVVEVTMQVHV